MHAHVAEEGTSTYELDLPPLDTLNHHLISGSTPHLLREPNSTTTFPDLVTNPSGQLEVGGVWASTTGLRQVDSIPVGSHSAQSFSSSILG